MLLFEESSFNYNLQNLEFENLLSLKLLGEEFNSEDVRDDNIIEDENRESSDDEEFEDASDFIKESPQVRVSSRSNKGVPPVRFANACVREILKPKSYNEAIKLPEKQEWLNAMQEEINAIRENDTWDL